MLLRLWFTLLWKIWAFEFWHLPSLRRNWLVYWLVFIHIPCFIIPKSTYASHGRTPTDSPNTTYTRIPNTVPSKPYILFPKLVTKSHIINVLNFVTNLWRTYLKSTWKIHCCIAWTSHISHTIVILYIHWMICMSCWLLFWSLVEIPWWTEIVIYLFSTLIWLLSL